MPVMGTAIAGECALLLSVDRDLLDTRTVHDTQIIRSVANWHRTTEIG
jgi:hypothetical protein